MDMEIRHPANGETVPDGADWIVVETLPDGRYNVVGCVAREQSVAFANEQFCTLDDAKFAGILWAKHRGAKTLYVDTQA